jgi:hypothetical protein
MYDLLQRMFPGERHGVIGRCVRYDAALARRPVMSEPLTSDNSPRKEIHLPARVVVSLRAGAVLAIANVICVLIFSWAWMHVRSESKSISVTGSAKKLIQSDLIVWRTKVFVNDAELVAAYKRLEQGVEKTLTYLKSKGISEKELTVSSVWLKKNYVKNDKGNDTDKISSYDMIQTVEVTSVNVQHVAEVARKITELLEQGVQVDSEAPEYHYTRMADLKITMLAEATKDATTRAQQIAANSQGKLGNILDARMGVMQINALHENEASGSGVNDTTSFEKEITAIVSAKFALK